MKRSIALIFALLLPWCGMSASPSLGSSPTESIVLGGGCFWCVEASYKLLPGVIHVTSGYAGGHAREPSYKQVCTGTTGHAEVVKIDFDPAVVSLAQVIDFFWKLHDPTTPDQQGHDVGPQYRSIILYKGEAQKKVAEASLAKAQNLFPDPIVTEMVSLGDFWEAEAYHQDYFAKNPSQSYCQAVIKPKIDKLKSGGKVPPH
jgi:peptide-methionine (S)-S-oxide reductase